MIIIDNRIDNHDRAVMLYIIENLRLSEKIANKYGLTIESVLEGELIISEIPETEIF